MLLGPTQNYHLISLFYFSENHCDSITTREHWPTWGPEKGFSTACPHRIGKWTGQIHANMDLLEIHRWWIIPPRPHEILNAEYRKFFLYLASLCMSCSLSLFSCLINPLCLNPNEGIILPLLHIIKDTEENLIISDPTNSQIVISTRPESKNNEISKWIESTGWRVYITQPAKVNCFRLLRCLHCITAPCSLTQPVSLTVLCHCRASLFGRLWRPVLRTPRFRRIVSRVPPTPWHGVAYHPTLPSRFASLHGKSRTLQGVISAN